MPAVRVRLVVVVLVVFVVLLGLRAVVEDVPESMADSASSALTRRWYSCTSGLSSLSRSRVWRSRSSTRSGMSLLIPGDARLGVSIHTQCAAVTQAWAQRGHASLSDDRRPPLRDGPPESPRALR